MQAHQNNNQTYKKTNRWSCYYYHHRRFIHVTIILVVIYAIIRLFFTPALLSNVPFGRAYYDRNDKLLRVTLSADDKYRLYTPLHEISPYLQQATILYEDRHFYYHCGINPISLFRATINYIMGHTHPAGASTITMQVARIRYNLSTTSPMGKLAQIAAAIYIDLFHTKSEILEYYLNMAPYGGNIEGISAASIIYFNTTAANLSQIEAITLATIPQNPTKRGLNTQTGITNIQNMRFDLITRWVSRFPSDTNLLTFANMSLNVMGTTKLPMHAPHFTDRMTSQLNPNWINSTRPEKSTVKTTLDLGLQHALEQKLRYEINTRRARGIENAAAMLVNYKTMQVLAHIGSADYFDTKILGQNDGTTAKRSPGSTLKPLIYATAADMGLIHGMTLLKDSKLNFGVYAPENADNEFYGPILARDALTHSRNIPAINLLRQIGIRNFYKILSDSGVSDLKTPGYYGISLALGGAEVSMYELADIYATMANLGARRAIRTTLDTPDTQYGQILSPEAFFLSLDMLSHQSTNNRSTPFAKNQTPSLRHYWKTGTSSSFRDAWTAGIFGDFVLIVWIGNFNGQPNNAFSGAKTAAPIYFALANSVQKYYATQSIPITDNNFLRDDLNISQIEMCSDVGGLAGPYCPKSEPAYFIPGKSPIETSSVYRAVSIDNQTGLRACTNDPDTTHPVVYEFWDAEYLDMFARAGLRRNTPPPFVPGCDLQDIAQISPPPIITAPLADARIVIISDADWESVSFQAITESENDTIFWFLDDEIIGTTHTGETFTYRVPMGSHTIQATTQSGTGHSINFSVVK